MITLDIEQIKSSVVVKNNKRIKIVLSIVFLSIVALIFIPSIIGNITHTKADTTRTVLMMINKVLEQFYADNGRFPTNVEGLTVLKQKSTGEGYFKNEKYMYDEWNNLFIYTPIEKEGAYNLYSIGENGIDEKGVGDDIGM